MDLELWSILAVVLGIPSISFLVLVFLGHKSNPKLDSGEMRRAITAFFIVLFGLLVAASYFSEAINLPGEIQGLFAGTVATIVGHYFGSRTAQTPPASPPG